MASELNILNSYGDDSVKEDVLGDIEILTATEDMIHNTLGKTKATTTVHEVLTDTLDDVTSLATAETADYSNTALTTPSRLTNLVQINVKKFEVSRTQRDIAHFQGEDELTRQVQKALKDWMNATEYELVRGSLVSGVSGTAPKMGMGLTQNPKEYIINLLNLIIYLCVKVKKEYRGIRVKSMIGKFAKVVIRNFTQQTQGKFIVQESVG